LKQEAHQQNTNEQQKKLLLAAKLLAEATSKIVEAAKGCATNPRDERAQASLRRAVDELRTATSIAAGDSSLQLKLIKRLELSAKQAASCATQTIAAVQVCIANSPAGGSDPLDESTASMLSHNTTSTQLVHQCKVVADYVPRIVQGIRACMVAPAAKSAHLCLISAAEDFLPPAHRMLALTKAVLPTLVNEIKMIQLRNCANQLVNSLADLKHCLARVGIIFLSCF
jgi:talin